MAIVICLEPETGTLNRYEIGGKSVRKTHSCSWQKPVTFTHKVLYEFRHFPPIETRVEPPPRPTNPPASAGIARAA